MLFEPLLCSVHYARWCGLRGGYATPTLKQPMSSGRSRPGNQQILHKILRIITDSALHCWESTEVPRTAVPILVWGDALLPKPRKKELTDR